MLLDYCKRLAGDGQRGRVAIRDDPQSQSVCALDRSVRCQRQSHRSDGSRTRRPIRPVHTCGRCHDYAAIAHGYHFNAMEKLADVGRPGEPWIWTDTRTGTQIPLSYRGWPGTYDPRAAGHQRLGLRAEVRTPFAGWWAGIAGSQLPRGEGARSLSARDLEQAGEAADEADEPAADAVPVPPDNGRWQLSGELAIDCMMCHGQDRAYSPEIWWEQISKQNFAWAPAAALGIADIDGDVSKLKDDGAGLPSRRRTLSSRGGEGR